MPDLTPTEKPEERAERAAEELAADGHQVSARAVRERSGVGMSVAAEAARMWNKRAAELAHVPDAPDAVRARFDGIWREAYVAAHEEFVAQRNALADKLRAAEEDRDALTTDLTQAESRIELLQAECDAIRAEATQAAAVAAARHAEELATERSRADRAAGALEAVTAERDRLLAQIESPRPAKRY
ncbi:replication region DNA-binding N-term [Micrococcales bacterium KH10]|nr:replication region DNA-binding N-term [Micrococcales bacterium KH10]